MDEPIRIGISACLLGSRVRYDGGHKRDDFLCDVFGRFVEWVPVCPEVELGLGVPRETLRLERVRGGVRLIATSSGRDLTAAMKVYAEERLDRLASQELCGYVLKKSSPSCGMERVKVYPAAGGAPSRDGRGLYAEALQARFPDLPLEEEGRLLDPRLRETFIERVFTYHRLRALLRGPFSVAALVAFHTAHKLLVLAHSPDAYRKLGRLVARARSLSGPALARRYRSELMAAVAVPASRGRHTNVLQHMAGYLTDRLDAPSRAELIAAIDDYRRQLVRWSCRSPSCGTTCGSTRLPISLARCTSSRTPGS
jgi:uncharacterized protein YbbK (DUF523 family)